MKTIRFLIKLLFPAVCPICGEVCGQNITEDDARICPACEKRVRRVTQPFCMRCGKPLGPGGARSEYCEDCRKHTHAFVQGRAVFVYGGAVARAMHGMKYKNRRDYAAVFAREAYETLGGWIRHIQPQALVPVPLHPRRRRTRGYNQAQLLAAELSGLTGIPVECGLIRRNENTRPQKELNVDERKNNLKNAFQMSKNSVHLMKVLVIDDIYTTGSTADAVAKTLQEAGIEKVYVLSICIGGDDQGGLDYGSKNL